MTQLTDIQAQIAALKAQAAEARKAEKIVAREVEREDAKIFREFRKAMQAEFLNQDRAAAQAAKAEARAKRAAQIAEIRGMLKAAGLRVRDLAETV